MFNYNNIKEIKSSDKTKIKKLFLKEAIKHCKIKKAIACEFGVASGSSLKLIANQTKLLTVGFDSWQGLPAEWDVGSHVFKKGHFQTQMPDPEKLGKNVILVKGLFKNTTREFKKSFIFQIGFMHIDCDLYDSAYCVLKNMNKKIIPGTIIAFDEIENFAQTKYKSTNQYNELLAFKNYLKRFKRKVKPIIKTNWYQVAFEVIK